MKKTFVFSTRPFLKLHTLANIYVYIILNIDNDQCEVSI